MISEVESFSKWIPIVGTLGGATLGFSASLLTTWFNNRAAYLRGKDDRNRNRLESIYELLIEIQRDYVLLMGKALFYIHEGMAITVDKNEKIPALSKLEMMVSLYFPDFKKEWKSLESAKNSFGEKLANLISSNEKFQLPERQKLALDFVLLEQTINMRVAEFQEAIIRSIRE